MNTRTAGIKIGSAILLVVFVFNVQESRVGAQDVFSAAQSGNVKMLRKIAETKPSDLNSTNSQKRSPLHLAVISNRIDAVKFLLEKKVNVDAKDQYERTPLHFAAMQGRKEIAKQLLNSGANPDLRDRSRQTPILFAITYRNDSEMAKMMLSKSKAKNASSNQYNGQTYLHYACQYGRLELAQYLIAQKVDLNVRDKQGVTPLMHAAQRGQTQLVRLMIQKGARQDIVDNYQRSLYHWAAMSGSVEVMKELKPSAQVLNQIDKGGQTPLTHAVTRNQLPIVKYLIECGADPAQTDSQGRNYSSLHYAIGNRNLPMLKLLIEKGADPEVKGPQGNSAIHMVAQYGYGGWRPNADDKTRKVFGEMAKLILDKGANVLTKNKQNKTALELAIDQENYLVVDAMVAKLDKIPRSFGEGRNLISWASEKGLVNTVRQILKSSREGIDQPNQQGRTPLFLASANGHVEIVGMLMEQKVDLNRLDENRESPLLVACWGGHLEVAKKLLAAGAKRDQLDESGQGCLHLAAWQGHPAVVKLLLENQFDANSATQSGYTPLHAASWNGSSEIASLLIKAGAKVDPRDSDGVTPLHKAAFKGHLDVVKTLIENGADRDAKDAIGFTALQKANGQKHEDVVKFLKESD